jgi:uncharacterized protein YjeT (DUF2065 family)
MTDFLTGVAFFLIIEGVLYAAAPSLVKNLAALLPSVADEQLRLSGLVALALGVLGVWLLRAA